MTSSKRRAKPRAPKGNGMEATPEKTEPTKPVEEATPEKKPVEEAKPKDAEALTQVDPAKDPRLTEAEKAVIADMDQSLLGMKVQMANIALDIDALEEQRLAISKTVRTRAAEVQAKLNQMLQKRTLNPAIEWTFDFKNMQFTPKGSQGGPPPPPPPPADA